MVQDGEATLECNVTGKPPPRVTWEWAGRPVDTEPGLRLQHQNRSLRVERARAGHAGHYSCVAQNVAGRAERRFALAVLGEGLRPACRGPAGGFDLQCSCCQESGRASSGPKRPPTLPLSLCPPPPLCSRPWGTYVASPAWLLVMGGLRGL